MKIKQILKKLFDFAIPPRCPSCGEIIGSSVGLCPKCFKKLEFITKPYCSKCGMPFEVDIYGENLLCPNCIKQKYKFDKARSVLVYNEASKNLILGFKHSRKIDLAPLFAVFLQNTDIIKNTDVVIPVPVHRLRLIKRGYNQSALLANALSKKSKTPVLYNVLFRKKATPYQGHLTLKERQANVKNAFIVKNANLIKNKNILLLDDVFTTGSTINECAKVLKKAKSGKIFALTIAKTTKS